MKFPSIFKKKSIFFPTLTGWLLLGGILLTTGFLFIANIHSFLSKTDPAGGDLLVVEGWQPDYALKEAAVIFLKGNYRMIVSTGGPLDNGSFLLQYKTYAQLGKLTINKMGIADSLAVAVPAGSVRKDRTYQSAKALKLWLEKSGTDIKKIDLVSLGTHTRRSSMVFQRVLSPEIIVGKIAIENIDYNPDQWWKSSEGVKSVITETISVIYTFFFLNFASG